MKFAFNRSPLLITSTNMVGVTVLRGIEDFGHASRTHTANILDLSTDLPIVLEVVDNQEKIDKLKNFFSSLDNAGSMLIIQETVTVVRYGKKKMTTL